MAEIQKEEKGNKDVLDNRRTEGNVKKMTEMIILYLLFVLCMLLVLLKLGHLINEDVLVAFVVVLDEIEAT